MRQQSIAFAPRRFAHLLIDEPADLRGAELVAGEVDRNRADQLARGSPVADPAVQRAEGPGQSPECSGAGAVGAALNAGGRLGLDRLLFPLIGQAKGGRPVVFQADAGAPLRAPCKHRQQARTAGCASRAATRIDRAGQRLRDDLAQGLAGLRIGGGDPAHLRLEVARQDRRGDRAEIDAQILVA
jgi:hypothetical protein